MYKIERDRIEKAVDNLDNEARREIGFGVNRETATKVITRFYREGYTEAISLNLYLQHVLNSVVGYSNRSYKRFLEVQLNALDIPEALKGKYEKEIFDCGFNAFLWAVGKPVYSLILPDRASQKRYFISMLTKRPSITVWLVEGCLKVAHITQHLGRDMDENEKWSLASAFIIEDLRNHALLTAKCILAERLKSIAEALIRQYDLVGDYTDVKNEVVPCLGFREWIFDYPYLCSPYQRTCWKSSTLSSDSYEKTSIVRGHGGIHWYWGLDLRPLVNRLDLVGVGDNARFIFGVDGSVLGFGAAQGMVCFGPEGGRSEFFRILVLIAPDKYIANRLSATYPDVKVFSIEDLLQTK
jgi:hypothetical protein